MVLRGEDRKALMLLANNVEANQAPKKIQLVFQQVGTGELSILTFMVHFR